MGRDECGGLRLSTKIEQADVSMLGHSSTYSLAVDALVGKKMTNESGRQTLTQPRSYKDPALGVGLWALNIQCSDKYRITKNDHDQNLVSRSVGGSAR